MEVLSVRVLVMLMDLRGLVDRVLEVFKLSRLTRDTLELVCRVKDEAAGAEYVKPWYTCIRDNTSKIFTELSRIVELREELEELRRTLVSSLSPGKFIEAARREDRGLSMSSNYYKYAPLIYLDPRILIPIEKELARYYSRLVGVEGLRTALNEIAKHTAHKIMLRKSNTGIVKDYGQGMATTMQRPQYGYTK